MVDKQTVLDSIDYRVFYKSFIPSLKDNGKVETLGLCPFHDDHDPSFSVNLETGLWFCHTCCGGGSVFDFYMKHEGADFPTALKEIAEMTQLATGSDKLKSTKEPTSTYDYQDVDGKVLFQACRYEPKDFRLRRPDGNGGWINNIKGITPIPYNLPEVIKADTVYICEGEKDCISLKSIGKVATTNPMGAGKWKDDYSKYLEGKDVVIFSDNDPPGKEHAEKVAASLRGIASSIKIVELSGLPEKGDVSDWLDDRDAKDTEDIIAELESIVASTPEWEEQTKHSDKEHQGITAAELITKELPEPKWAVRNIITEGLNILAAKPKMGKSINALNTGVSITTVGKALGSIEVEQGTVIYLALEDTERRLQSRLKRMIPGGAPGLEKLHLFTRWPRMEQGGLEALEEEIQKHPDLRLVIIDTYAKFKPPGKKTNSTLYDDDYKVGSDIKDLADKYSISILIIHHQRKMPSEDIMDTFSGTLGLTAAADTLLVLQRTTGKTDAVLHINGRDVEPGEYALKFESSTLSWQLLGDVKEIKSTELRQTVFDGIKNSDGVVTIPELVESTGLEYKVIQRQLEELLKDGSISKPERGKYSYVPDIPDKADKT